MEAALNNVFSINHRPSAGSAKQAAPEDRVSFVEYVAKVTEAYLNGEIDSIVIGHVDGDGIPVVEFGSFPVNMGNDILALAVETHQVGSGLCQEARDIILNGS